MFFGKDTLFTQVVRVLASQRAFAAVMRDVTNACCLNSSNSPKPLKSTDNDGVSRQGLAPYVAILSDNVNFCFYGEGMGSRNACSVVVILPLVMQ